MIGGRKGGKRSGRPNTSIASTSFLNAKNYPMDKQTKPVEVTATVAFDNKGTRSYRTIIYCVAQWQDAMVDLFATNGWQTLEQQFHGEPKIYGITFNFKSK